MDKTTQLEQKIAQLQNDLKAINDEFYLNNFSARQDFYKYCDFKTRFKLPTLAALPTVCEQGEKCVLSTTGKEYVCSAANTWTIVGTQS